MKEPRIILALIITFVAVVFFVCFMAITDLFAVMSVHGEACRNDGIKTLLGCLNHLPN